MSESLNKTNPCEACESYLLELAEKTDITNEELNPLRKAEKVIELDVTFEKDDGSQETVKGFRVQYNSILGPTKGGLRFHKGVNLEEVTELSFLMALKTSLVGLPYGGGKGGIQINPKELSATELEKLSRAFMRELAPHIGPQVDIPAPDVNTTPEIMSWMLDEYEKTVGHPEPAVLTGKPIEKGGSEGRTSATGLGGFFILEEKYKEKDPSDITVALQGFGNVSQYAALALYQKGFKVVAVSDSKTGIYNKDGLNIEDLKEFKYGKGSFLDYEAAEQISNEDLLELDVDVLAPSALGGVITKENVENIKAKTIIELANGPITPEADEILTQKGIEVIPDILANSGGVTVSYFEWRQNLDNEHWTQVDVNTKLQTTVLNAYKNVVAESERQSIDLRTASYYIAVKRILKGK